MTVLLDGAMGTELSRRGFSLVSPKGSAGALVEDPDLVRAIHLETVHAGAQVITTNTFSLVEPDADAATLSVRLAREAIVHAAPDRPDAPRVRVAGCMGALGRRASHAHNAERYRAWGEAFITAGCDLLVVETLIDTTDAEVAAAALRPARARCPVWISAAFGLGGASFGEGSAAQMPVADVDAFLVACTERDALAPSLANIPRHDGVWRGAAPSMGRTVDGKFLADGADPESLTEALLQLTASCGLQVIGGCCGTTPAWIAGVAGRLHPTPQARALAFDALDAHVEQRP